jgi:outer membrane protein OmpA-like peptidoglycan-associated protein
MHVLVRGLSAIALALVPLLIRAADPPPDEAGPPQLSEQQIRDALHPPATRSFTPTRGFSTERGLARTEQLQHQSVDLNIQFDHNSSNLRPSAFAQLQALQKALNGLRADHFIVAGHTDAQGNPGYNKQLSLRRAEAVKQFLVASGIPQDHLRTVGYGSERLHLPDRPLDPSNRRVEIQDLGGGSP